MACSSLLLLPLVYLFVNSHPITDDRTTVGGTSNDVLSNLESTTVEPKLQWISNFMPHKLLNFIPRSKFNSECTKQGQLYQLHLANSTLWAVQMLDASVISQVGVLTSSSYNFGTFDQCVRISVPTHSILGQYCLVSLEFAPQRSLYPKYYDEEPPGVYRDPDPLSSVWEKIKKSSDPRIKYRDTIYWAMCLPASCTNEDLADSLSEDLLPVLKQNGIVGNISVKKTLCQSAKDSSKLGPASYSYLSILGLLILVCLIATFCNTDVGLEDSEDQNGSWFRHFCVTTNLRKLMELDSPNEFHLLSGTKVLSMAIIIYGHRMLTTLYTPIINPEYHERRYGRFLETINFNGPIVVNTFLVISGFLAYYKIIKDIDKKRGINIPLYIFYRWMRITPIYLFIILFNAIIMPHLPGGPLWKSEGWWRHKACWENWWTHILYINNYYNSEQECLIPSWYMAVDMQLYITCVFVGYILWKNKKIAHCILIVLFLASIITPIFIVLKGKYDAIIKFYLNYLPRYYASEDYINTYTRTHMRAAPYFLGMATALVYTKLKKKKYQFSKWQMASGTLLAIVSALGSLFGAWVFFIPSRANNFLENGLYASLHKVGWALAFSWILTAEGTTGCGIFSAILSHYFFAPFNKLTLCALLVHTPLQQYLFLKQRSTIYLDNWNVIWMSCGDILVTYIVALFLHLFIEAPTAAIQDALLRKMFGQKKAMKKERDVSDPEITNQIYTVMQPPLHTSINKENA